MVNKTVEMIFHSQNQLQNIRRNYSNNNHGQSLVESLVASIALLPVVLMVLGLLFQIGSKVWIEHWLYESLVCMQSTQENSISSKYFSNRNLCQQRLKKQIEILPLLHVTQLQLQNTQKSCCKGEISFFATWNENKIYKKNDEVCVENTNSEI